MTGTSTRAEHPRERGSPAASPRVRAPANTTREPAPERSRPGCQYAGTGAPLAAKTSPAARRFSARRALSVGSWETPGGTTNGPVVPRTAGPFAVYALNPTSPQRETEPVGAQGLRPPGSPPPAHGGGGW